VRCSITALKNGLNLYECLPTCDYNDKLRPIILDEGQTEEIATRAFYITFEKFEQRLHVSIFDLSFLAKCLHFPSKHGIYSFFFSFPFQLDRNALVHHPYRRHLNETARAY